MVSPFRIVPRCESNRGARRTRPARRVELASCARRARRVGRTVLSRSEALLRPLARACGTIAEVTDTLKLVGTTIGDKYVLEGIVGEGGFAVVYKAQHKLWKRP